MSVQDDRTDRVAGLLADGIGVLSAVWGSLILMGWAFQVARIVQPRLSLTPVSPDTALVAITTGVALVACRHLSGASRRFLWLPLGVSGLLSALNLLQMAVGRDLGVGPLLFRGPGSDPMAPNTAIAMVALTIAIACLPRSPRHLVTLSQGLALFGGALGAFAGIGYIYGARGLIGVESYTLMALPTAGYLIVMAVGVHALAPRDGWVACLLRSDAGGLLLRRLLPIMLLLPVVTGFLALMGQQSGWFDTPFGYAIVACVDAVLLAWLLITVAASLSQSEVGRTGERLLREKLEQLGSATVAISGAILSSQQVGLSESLQIRANLDLQAIMQAIVEQAANVTDAEMAALGIGTDPEVSFCPWVFAGMPAGTVDRVGRYPRPIGVLGLVARDGQTLRLTDVTQHEAFRGLPEGHPPIGSFLAVPIQYDGENVGNLYLGNKRNAIGFTIEDQRAVELLAPHAAIALQQATLRATISTQRAHIDTILSAAPNGVIFLDAVSGAVSANPMAAGMFGLRLPANRDDCQSLCLLHHPDGRPAEPQELPSSRVLAGQAVATEEWLIIRPDGGRVPVLVSAAPLFGQGDCIEGAVITLQDISGRKALERTRDEYLSLITHDLRGPLSVIGLQAAFLQRSGDSAVVDKAKGIADNVNRLTAMISDLVEVTRLEAGALRLDRHAVTVRDLVARLLQSGMSDEDRQHVRMDLPAGLPPMAIDAARIDRVLLNLIGNARKYAGPAWQVVLSARPVHGMIEIQVADNGPGFPEVDLPRVFEKYFRGRQRDAAEGLGLGLYICRLIINAHGGRIWAENRRRGGAVIGFRLPIATPGAREAA